MHNGKCIQSQGSQKGSRSGHPCTSLFTSFQGVYKHISHLDYNLQLLKLSDFERSHETPVSTLKIFICSYFFLDFLWTLDIKKGWIKFFKLTQIQGRFVKCHHNFICFVIFDYLILRHS